VSFFGFFFRRRQVRSIQANVGVEFKGVRSGV